MRTSTQARKEFFDLLEAAQLQGQVTQITKHGRVVAEIRPPEQEEFDWDAYLEEILQTGPILSEQDAQEILAIRKNWKSRFPDW